MPFEASLDAHSAERSRVPKALALGGRHNKAKMAELNRQRLAFSALATVRSYAHPDRAEPNILESYGLRVTILMAVSILCR